jgi:phosphohistidine phosphatase SixA/8-oxo-dGTP pyrophosphatase MutT (NUDIX family)
VTGEIRAAGGVVWRDDDGVPRVAIVHRNRYDDWTLPKGKLEPGESAFAAAGREVAEETGARVAVTRRLGEVHYLVDGVTPKSVRFWAMRYLSGEFTPSDEVDGLRWLAVADAREQLSYDRERGILDAFMAVPIPQSVVALVRHAKAGRRSDWHGDDRLRPLEKTGRRQARKLATFLREFAPERILSADRTRCVQTVEPLAALIGREIDVVASLSDEAYVNDPDTACSELLAIAKSTTAAVLCSQGTAIPGLVARLAKLPPESVVTRKGAVWILAVADGVMVSADYYGRAAP